MAYDLTVYELVGGFLMDHKKFENMSKEDRDRIQDEMAQSVQTYIENWIEYEIGVE